MTQTLDLQKMKLALMSHTEIMEINGGNGVHGAGYTVSQDQSALGAAIAGLIVGTLKGLFNRK